MSWPLSVPITLEQVVLKAREIREQRAKLPSPLAKSA
jgi:hypothetical protein